MMWFTESRREKNLQTYLLSYRTISKIGIWNVRTMCELGMVALVTWEMNITWVALWDYAKQDGCKHTSYPEHILTSTVLMAYKGQCFSY